VGAGSQQELVIGDLLPVIQNGDMRIGLQAGDTAAERVSTWTGYW
jgi:hypothetical protein